MGDALKKVTSGSPLAIPAAAYNAFIDAARAEQARQGDQEIGAAPAHRESGVVLIKNTTESDLARFAILGIDAPVFTPTDNEQEFKNRVAFKGVTPVLDDHQLRFAILLEPLAAGRIGLGMVQGVTPVRLYVTNEGHRGAGMEEGKTGYLSSQASAYATTVLWKESGVSESEEDLKWAVIAFRGGSEVVFGASVGLAEVVQIYDADGNVWVSYAANGWQAYVEAYPIVRVYNEETEEWEWVPDAEVMLLLKLNAACGTAEVGFKDVAGGDWIGYVRATDNLDVAGRPPGTKFDGWVLLHGGDRGTWLSALQHAAGGPGIDVDEAADPFKPKVKVDLHAVPGLEFDPAGVDAGKLRVLPDRNRGLDLDAAGIFIDLADANPGLTFDGGDLKVLPDTEEGIKVDAEGVGVKINDGVDGLRFDAGVLKTKPDNQRGIDVDGNGLYVKIDTNGPLFISNATGELDLGVADLAGLTSDDWGNLKAWIDTARGIYFEAGKIAVNLETTNLEFDGGAVKHKQNAVPIRGVMFRVVDGKLEMRTSLNQVDWSDWESQDVGYPCVYFDGAGHQTNFFMWD